MKRLIKEMLKRLLTKNYHVAMYLKFPDGLEESRGYDIPKDLDCMMKAINSFVKAGYSIRAEIWDWSHLKK